MKYDSPYDCPTCGWESPDSDTTYKATKHKVQYPKITNTRKYYNGSNDMHDWDETHYCKKCKAEFTFSNGAV